MKYATIRRLVILVGLLVVVGFPLVGKWARRDAAARCAYSGLPIEPLYRVRVVDASGEVSEFCCVRCAQSWLVRQGDGPREVRVTDEAGGDEIDATAAQFVESAVVTNSVTGNRVHTFRNRSDAAAHAHAFGGTLLTDEERPFQSW